MKQFFYLGNYSNTGFSLLAFSNSKLSLISNSNHFSNVSYVHSSNHLLYHIVESPPDKKSYVVAYQKNSDSSFTLLNAKELSDGSGPCYLTIDEKRNHMYVANYGNGSFEIFSLHHNGSIGKRINFQTFPNNSRIHFIAFSKENNYLFAIDLGRDLLLCYEIVASSSPFELQLCHQYHFPLYSHPRHLVISKSGILYVITENSCQLHQLSFNSQDGFKLISTYDLLPPEYDLLENYTGCAIKISNDNKFIYTTIRGHQSISVFSNTSDTLTLVQNISCFGKTPRDISFDATQDILLCANQDSNSISIFHRNKENGMLSFMNHYASPAPACITQVV